MAILVGPVPAGADGPIPIHVEIEPVTDVPDGLDAVYGDERTRGRATQRVVQSARDAYTDGLDLARRCAAQAVRRFGDLGEEMRPDEIEMQLAIKVDAGVAALVTSKAEAQLQITFRWRTDGRPETPPPDEDSAQPDESGGDGS
ncbi:CU044_2847 family protein [Streptomyces sp. MB09-02B]|uniref:CU044_2847 family protein n=1 Tax=Streptomyces sp. MB09-02B TaxID=3028667 RepID=UPI0029B972D5|nr:CU044_2847 family protein [Streptomyces sp. MB09-02B]MDX3642921.1 CU044_2847 family protein [Streptomyces sp. MB09-02B]